MSEKVETAMDCKIGCNIVDPLCDDSENYTLPVYLKNIAKYRNYGISHLEFSHVTMLSEDDAVEIREFCRINGMVPWSVHSEHLNAPGKAALAKYLRTETKCAEITKALDAKVMVCHIPNVEPRAAAFDRDLAVLSSVSDITRAHGLILAVETYPADYIIKLVDAIDRDDVGINLDTGHSYLFDSKNVASVARKIGKRLVTTHIQDNFGTNDDHQPAGLGKIEWFSTLKAIKKTGYSGPLMMELTGGGVKARRSTESLRTFELEKEIIYASAYLKFLWKKIR
jgi:sugar phosphate isomerase/epimerase